ncbi:hypothetical protein EJ04DRAFT_551355 [Polyplosphaeria fusca]|uniref:Zn(2)-C6 fungal-type domain-containing protein n=1 Tax=Polyplosphaeria fusca TaxID=682080 RepID=A0A9P4R4F7_9PLEO|nr:hypothetical protein EJ04DRAFT_551355 [Polyplosphaeria fusca]
MNDVLRESCRLLVESATGQPSNTSDHPLATQVATQVGSNENNDTAARPPLRVSCISCRSRHLKCDGGTRCNRCKADQTDCVYIQTRRGWKGPRRRGQFLLENRSSFPSEIKLEPDIFYEADDDIPGYHRHLRGSLSALITDVSKLGKDLTLDETTSTSGSYLKRLNDIMAQHTPHVPPITLISDIVTPDWSFLKQDPIETIPECPSLASNTTVTSRNSSTRSTRSYEGLEGQCPISECGRFFKDLKAHMLAHQTLRPEKCPIETCEYYLKGFTRSADQARHTSTHFKGTLHCDFCPSLGPNKEGFAQLDHFLRHLKSKHGVISDSTLQEDTREEDFLAVRDRDLDHAVADCSLCAEPFDPQGMYSHLPGCVVRRVTEGQVETWNQNPEPRENANDEDGSKTSRDDATGSAISTAIAETGDDFTGLPSDTSLTDNSPDHLQSRPPGSPIGKCSVVDAEKVLPTNTSRRNQMDNLQDKEHEDRDVAAITASSRCLSLTSSNAVGSSEEETDWTDEAYASSPLSDVDPTRVGRVLSPVKQQLVDSVMGEFHRLFDHRSFLKGAQPPHIRTCYGGDSNQTFYGGSASSWSNESSMDSGSMSRKRSLSGGSSRPPNRDRDNGEDPNKRRRPDNKPEAKESVPERRFACPFYKRDPGRHQTFTSCRDPGFISVARLKEHLYRRHLLPIQCNRCCSTFPSESSLKEHQRDPRGCEVREQAPREGFDKDQERKLKSKKRSQVHLSEEDKWNVVYKILFPDDDEAEMPSPYIEYQPPGAVAPQGETNITRFHEFSRLELPRLVRRTLETVVEEEAQPLEDKLKDRLVDIVKECQTQLFSMFREDARFPHGDATPSLALASSPSTQQDSATPNALVEQPFTEFDSSLLDSYPAVSDKGKQRMSTDATHAFAQALPTFDNEQKTLAGTVPHQTGFEIPTYANDSFVDLAGYYGLFTHQDAQGATAPGTGSAPYDFAMGMQMERFSGDFSMYGFEDPALRGQMQG